jgi:hypothetical protein
MDESNDYYISKENRENKGSQVWHTKANIFKKYCGSFFFAAADEEVLHLHNYILEDFSTLNVIQQA